jgi:hypothetical protein
MSCARLPSFHHRSDLTARSIARKRSGVLLDGVLDGAAGLRLAIGRAILGVVVGEFFGSSQGLGYMIASAATNYKVDVVFVGVVIFMALSVILTLAVKQLESRLASWRPEAAKTF